MSDRTVHLHRVLRTPPERLYRAFLEADALAKWLPPHGFTCQVQQLDARVGGQFRMSFRNFGTGGAHAFGGEYLELVPGELIRYTDRFDDPHLPGVLEVAVYGLPDPVKTEIVVAAVVPRPGQLLTAQQVIEYCQANIAAYKVPARVDIVSELPKSATGKILKRVLRDAGTPAP